VLRAGSREGGGTGGKANQRRQDKSKTLRVSGPLFQERRRPWVGLRGSLL
jgi:hypothetical protein